jgi:tetratricopeptide (TPR) repeat protein
MKPLTPAQVEEAKLFANYIHRKITIVADPSSVARSAIAQCLNSLGARTSNIVLVSNFDEAQHQISRLKPHLIIAEYDLGKRCGLELLQMQRTERPDGRDSLFILVTGNTSQTAVANSAEEDVDTFVLKPFTLSKLKELILRAAVLKIRPPAYVVEIERGKSTMLAGQLDEAFEIFENCKNLDPTPSLACFYKAQIHVHKHDYDAALKDYNEGLSYNQVHYRCLVGLYELYQERGEHKRAYDIIRTIAQYFPANPHRLTAVLRLAILTQNYDDIERYYNIFINIEPRSEESVRYICAALVVCGKHYLKTSNPTRAIEVFQKAAATGNSRTKILREIVTTLVEHSQLNDAEIFLSKFPPETQSSIDYASANLAIVDRLQGASMAIDRARQYI